MRGELTLNVGIWVFAVLLLVGISWLSRLLTEDAKSWISCRKEQPKRQIFAPIPTRGSLSKLPKARSHTRIGSICQWVATPTPSLPWQRHQHHQASFLSSADSYEPGLRCLSANDPIPLSANCPSSWFPSHRDSCIVSFDLHTHSGEEP